jgi:hypothetical protein
MSSIVLQLPANLSDRAVKALSTGYFVGLPDYMPWITQSQLRDGQLIAEKEIHDSGCFCAPWLLAADFADELPSPLLKSRLPLMLSTATLAERAEPYRLLVELARGRVNQLRNQAADWESGGLELPAAIDEAIRNVSRTFGRAVCQCSDADADKDSEEALLLALATGEDLVSEYVAQVMKARTTRTPRLPTLFGCNVTAPTTQTELLKSAFNTLRAPLNWRQIEEREGTYNWEPFDAWLAWARPLGLTLEVGPLFEMSPTRLPEWLPTKLGDPQGVANLMLEFLEAALERYRDQIKFWMITSGMNDPNLLELDEEESLWLNTQLYATAQQVHPSGEFSLGLAQPWGEAVARGSPAYSPFVFADALMRSRVLLSSLDLELVFGVAPRGSVGRDRLDLSRLFDLYALLGVPLKVTLGVPAAATDDPNRDHAYGMDSLYGADAWTPQTQAGWVEMLSQLIICKPFISSLVYAQFNDAQPHRFPNLGLLDGRGEPRPALAKLRELREKYLS